MIAGVVKIAKIEAIAEPAETTGSATIVDAGGTIWSGLTSLSGQLQQLLARLVKLWECSISQRASSAFSPSAERSGYSIVLQISTAAET